MRSSIVILLLCFLTSASLGYSFCSCSGAKNNHPDIQVSELIFSEFTSDRIEIKVTLEIENPNSEAGLLNYMEYSIFFGHHDRWMLLDYGEKESLNILPQEKTEIVITEVIEDRHRRNIIFDTLLGDEPSQIKLEGDASIELMSDSFEVAFEKKSDVAQTE